MEPGQYQLQIFDSLIVILGAAFVALICDFLKGSNEQLREMAIELRARDAERRLEMPEARSIEPLTETPAARQAVTVDTLGEPTPAHTPEAGATAAPGKQRRSRAAEALAAMEGAASTISDLSEVPREAAPVQAAATAAEKVTVDPDPAPSAPPAITTVKPDATPIKNSGAKRDWNLLLAHSAAAARNGFQEIPEHGHREPEHAKQTEAHVAPPAGFHDRHTLARLVEDPLPVSGLVVSIGVNSTRKGDGTNFEGVQSLIESLIGPGDFACHSNDHEFLLIYPHDRGAQAQRRLNEIAQELWSFQLSALRTHPLIFSWGGIEVRDEMFGEAIASASERMQESRRGRKLLTMERRSDIGLREAV